MKKTGSIPTVNARVTIPGSKSMSHRMAIASALAIGKSHIKGFLSCEDTFFTISGLRKLGMDISLIEEELHVEGSGGYFSRNSGRTEIYVGNSGTSLRLLLSFVSLAQGDIILTGDPRLKERPIGELVKALNQLGVKIDFLENPGQPPVLVHANGILGGSTRIKAKESSQFVSSLLLASPYAENDTEIHVIEELVSRPYIDLTIEVMRRFGVSVEQNGYKYFKIKSGHLYKGQNLTIEGDASTASYFWAAAAITGGRIVTDNIYPFQTTQGDIDFLHLLEEMGCDIKRHSDHVEVFGRTLKGIEVDMSQMPDMVPTLAGIALFTDGKTSIRNVAHLRYKESDRLSVIATEWRRLGGHVEELPDGLIIEGNYELKPAIVNPHDDHRIAMSLAIIGLRLPGLQIMNKECVRKSYPHFWDVWNDLCQRSEISSL